MARDGYLSIRLDGNTKLLLDQFTEAKGISKANVFNEMAESYMRAKDEELYLKLKEGNQDKEFLLKEKLIARHFNDPVFLRIKHSFNQNGEPVPEQQVIQEYIASIRNNGLGFTWFSTNALANGMSQERVIAYNKLIELGENIEFYIAFTSTNNIEYKAKVLEVCSDSTGLAAPNLKAVPDIFKYESKRMVKPKIWLKIKGLDIEKGVTASDFSIRTSNSNLKSILDVSQYVMGYIYKNKA